MAKKALGRGLGELLSGEGTPARSAPTPSLKGKDASELGPGLRVLILQRNGTEAHKREAAVSPGKSPGVTVSLVLADVAIVTLVFLWLWTLERPLTAGEAGICVIAVSFAAWLGCLAAWREIRGSP